MSWVLFFDGDCAFCSRSVRRIVRMDKRGVVSFAPLQGRLAEEVGVAHHAAKSGGTLVLLREEDGRIFTRSDALIELAQALGGPWKLLRAAGWLPKFLRDAMYSLVADNRHRLPGKTDACELPDPLLVARLRE
jgi:predicted DCC family thiol-disulfide oxidoreductase YuxK